MEVKEVWKDVVGYEGLYQVSNIGRVKSLDRYVRTKNHKMFVKGKVLKASPSKRGYPRVTLRKDGKSKYLKVHRIVAFAFIPIQKDKNLINHIDGNKTNNCIDNLEWCNQSENFRHALKTGLMKQPLGEANGQSKLNAEKVRKIRSMYLTGKYSFVKLAKIFNVHSSAIECVINKKNWKWVD